MKTANKTRQLTTAALCAALLCVVSPWSIVIGPISLTLAVFGVFFAEHNIGLSLDDFGRINGLVAFFIMVLSYPLGWLADRLHPLRCYIFAVILVIVTNVFSYFFTVDRLSYIVTTVLLSVVYAIQGASTLPMFARLLPRERYGQFCSAQAVFNALLLVLANWGGGLFIDLTGCRIAAV